MAHRCRRFALWLSCVLGCSCDLGVPDPGDPNWSLHSAPADGARAVPRADPLEIRLDRRVLPRTVTGANVRLASGAFRPPYALRYDVLDRSIQLLLPSWAPLAPDTVYQLELEDLIDLDAVTQPQIYRVFFKTGVDSGNGPLPTAASDVSAVLALLRGRCASAGCHGATDAAAELDLSDGPGIERTAKRLSSQLGLQTLGSKPADGALWLPATRIIDATPDGGDPARSYLVYKVLGDPHIAGDVMPPRGARLTHDELEQIAQWIATGAATADTKE
jgi:hypothetical protein